MTPFTRGAATTLGIIAAYIAAVMACTAWHHPMKPLVVAALIVAGVLARELAHRRGERSLGAQAGALGRRDRRVFRVGTAPARK